MLEYGEIKINKEKLSRKHIAKETGCSVFTIKRHRDDLSMDSPYNRRNTREPKTPKDFLQPNPMLKKVYKK